MIANVQTQATHSEAIHPPSDWPLSDWPPSDWQQLAQENGCLRQIISELLMKNQSLRWALLGQGLSMQGVIPAGTVYEPRFLTASEGTPLRKKSRTAGIP